MATSSFDNAQITSYGDRMQIFGLGSQWDTKTILEAELNILQLRQKPFQTKKSDYESEKQTWTALQTSLTNFNKIVTNLKDLNTSGKDVKLSEDGFITASATGVALDASYSVSVQQLATKHRIMSDQIAEGALSIDEKVQLNGKDLTITADMDIKGIAKAINSGDYGVDAVVLNNKLVLTSKKFGTDNAIKFSDSTAWETLGLTQGGAIKNELQAAKGAIFTINDIQITSNENSYSEIDGLTFNFTKETTSNIEVNVSRSADQLVEKVTAVINAYNSTINNINSLGGEKGVLQGEGVPRNLKREMNNLLFGVNNAGSMLYDLGITLNKDAKNGTLTFDESKLRTMYDSDPQKAQDMLGKNGFSGQLYTVIDNYSKSSGLVQTEIDGLNNRIKRIDDTLDRYDKQFEQQKEAMIQKYATFETMMGSMSKQSDYINAALGLKNNNDN
ncbi:flagellar filament capping protein FliD [Priestia megaterium]|uniref:Flagellar hook-associated protein 2 n=1 Tax=Priestia megaterium TaxID=1404 RepID=A0A6M6E1C0_PRIMG|nr:flagellar filament capping protein FliD [Priestia megaterium]QJX80600.1 flagellar filament capping protein FliD [Priestia megaterium]